MAAHSKIEWTEATWNPVTGCSKVSPGCKNCYAERLAKRLQAMGNRSYGNGFEVTLHPRLIELPLRWKTPRSIFVNSMSDLFHEQVSVEFIRQVFEVMNKARHHRFQILTKRAHRLAELGKELPWSDNIWMGVSIESSDFISRIDHLKSVGAGVRFLSMEPLLGPVANLGLDGIGWVIVGGESGPGARMMASSWVLNIRDQCLKANVPFFFKQWGGTNRCKSGRLLEGRAWDEFPKTSLFEASVANP